MCQLQGEELQLVREALRSLRDNFSGHDPQHHTLDTLEQGVSSLVDRLHSLESQRRQDRGVHTHTHRCMMDHRIFNSSFFSRSLNLQHAEPTRQTATLGHRAQVRQAKSLFSCVSKVFICCNISSLAVKSDCSVAFHLHGAWSIMGREV